MTRVKKRNEKKKYGKDFASFCKILNRYFPDLSGWLASLKDPSLFSHNLYHHSSTIHVPGSLYILS